MEEEKGTNDLLTTKENQDENDDSIGPPLKKRRDGDSEDFKHDGTEAGINQAVKAAKEHIHGAQATTSSYRGRYTEETDLDEPDEQNHATSRNGTELLQRRNGDWQIRRGDGKVIHNGTEKSAKQLWKQLFSSKTGTRN